LAVILTDLFVYYFIVLSGGSTGAIGAIAPSGDGFGAPPQTLKMPPPNVQTMFLIAEGGLGAAF